MRADAQAVLDMDQALTALRLELSDAVWEDVKRRWAAVRPLALKGALIDGSECG